MFKTAVLWVIVVGVTLLTTLFFWLIALHYLSTPTISNFLKLDSSLILSNPQRDLHVIKEMVKDGSILTLDQLWSIQSSFYQTIITTLIALNGILVAFAFIFIKNTSYEKAIEAAVEHVNRHLSTIEFDNLVNKKLDDRIAQLKADYEFKAQQMESLMESVDGQSQQLTSLVSEQSDMKRQIKVISSAISQIDNTEETSESLRLKK